MAKTFKSNFQISQLDKVSNDILSQLILNSGVDTAGTVEALRAMKVDKLFGFENFTQAQSQRQLDLLAKSFAKNGYVAASKVGKAMAKYDPFKLNKEGAKRGDASDLTEAEKQDYLRLESSYKQNADVVLHALNDVGVEEKSRGLGRGKEDFRSYEDFTKGLERFLEQYKKQPDNFNAQEVWGVLAAAGYAKEVYDANIEKFNILKEYQQKSGFILDPQDTSNVYVRMWNSLGVDIQDVNNILAGNNVPNSIILEDAEYFAGDISQFDLGEKDDGRNTPSGFNTYSKVLDQLSSEALKGVLVQQLGLNGCAVPVGVDETGAPQMQTYNARQLSALPQDQLTALKPLLLRNGETELSEVEARLSNVADTIRNITEGLIESVKDANGQLNLYKLSPDIRNYLNGYECIPKRDEKGDFVRDIDDGSIQMDVRQPLFADDQAKEAYLRETLLIRGLEAAITSGAANLTDESEMLYEISKELTKPENETILVPSYNDDGTPRLNEYGGQFHTESTFYGAQNVLLYNGQALIYDGKLPEALLQPKTPEELANMSEKEIREYNEAQEVAFGEVIVKLQEKYEGEIEDLNLSGAKLEDFTTAVESQKILFHDGLALIYDGELPEALQPKSDEELANMSKKEIREYNEAQEVAFGEVVAKLQAKYKDFDLGGAKLEDFRTADPMSTGFAGKALNVKKEQEKKEEDELKRSAPAQNSNPTPQSINPTQTSTTNQTQTTDDPELESIKPEDEGPVLFRGTAQYEALSREFEIIYKNSGLKFIHAKKNDNTQTQTGNGQEPTFTAPPVAGQGGDQSQTGDSQGDNQTQTGNDIPPKPTAEETRAEIKSEVKAVHNGDPKVSTNAAIKEQLAIQLGVTPNDITKDVMQALTAHIYAWGTRSVNECVKAFAQGYDAAIDVAIDKFNLQKGDPLPEGFLSAYSQSTLKQFVNYPEVRSSLDRVESFADQFSQEFVGEEVNTVKSQMGKAGEILSEEEIKLLSISKETELREEAEEYLVTEELWNLLKNGNMKAGEITPIDTPEIPSATPTITQDMGMGGQG